LNIERSKEGHMSINYNFLVKLFSELTQDQKNKLIKNIQYSNNNISKAG